MKKILFYIFLLSAVSCRYEHLEQRLSDVGTYMSERPDSALAVLDSLHGEGIRGRKNKAHYALLYSMALDKNYIDETDDSLINIAVRWYRRHGSPDEKLKAWYYLGRVQQNAGDNEAAMESFVRAEQENSTDMVTKGLLYNSIASIYLSLFDIEKAETYFREAGKCYLSVGNNDKYSGTLLNLTNLDLMAENYEQAWQKMDSVRLLWDCIGEYRKRIWYETAVSLYTDAGDNVLLAYAIDDYLSEFEDADVDWLAIAEAYIYLGDTASAMHAVDEYRESEPDYLKMPAYHMVLSSIYELNGSYEKSITSYKDYYAIKDSITEAIFDSDIKFIEERYLKEQELLKASNSRNRIIIFSIVVFLILLALIYTIARWLRKRNDEIIQNKRMYAELLSERDELAEIIDNSRDDESGRVLRDRLNLLNGFFTDAILDKSNMESQIVAELSRLVEDREHFLYNSRLAFSCSHPEFIRTLKSKGLSDMEIEYCCLYAMGLRGKDVANYTGKSRHYSDMTVIREKLGLSVHDTNLGNYLRTLLKN